VTERTKVFMYWEDLPGRTCPPYLDLCLETIRVHVGESMELLVLDQDSVFDWIPDLDASVWRGLPLPAKRSDYARTRLTYHHGGLWLDADTIAVGPLSPLTDYVADHDLACWGGDVGGRFFSSLIVARAGAPLIEKWMEAQDRALADSADWGQLTWSALVADAFGPFMADDRYVSIPSSKIAPIAWNEWMRFFSRFQSPAPILSDRPSLITLYNKGMGPILENTTEAELRRGKSLLSRLFRIGLGQSTLSDEVDLSTKLSPLSDLRYGLNGRRVERRVRRALFGKPPPSLYQASTRID
jgi:Capsular polysaccharide synthesis protein